MNGNKKEINLVDIKGNELYPYFEFLHYLALAGSAFKSPYGPKELKDMWFWLDLAQDSHVAHNLPEEYMSLYIALASDNSRNYKDVSRQKNKQQYLYLIKHPDSGHLKLGFSTVPKQRISQIQCHTPSPLEVIGIIEGDKKLEAQLHHQFKKRRVRGEWFQDTPEMRKLFKDSRTTNPCLA